MTVRRQESWDAVTALATGLVAVVELSRGDWLHLPVYALVLSLLWRVRLMRRLLRDDPEVVRS